MKEMKKIYLNPSVKMENMEMSAMVCNSQDITSNQGINYGGVDEDGSKDPSSREYDSWVEESEYEE